jgi:glycosyltransferase involved in cell wall biosynthesis
MAVERGTYHNECRNHVLYCALMPAVSVVINLYNGKDTVAETIESVRAQTFGDWELLVWDDASRDGGEEVVAQFKDARIRCVRVEEPGALGQARQAAIASTTGEWIAFLDQDDVWLPRKLERQMQLARERPEAGWVYGRTIRFYPNGSERDYDQAHEYSRLPEDDIFASLFEDSCYIAMSSAMFRRAAIEAVGGIPERIRIIPDYYLYTAVARRFPVAAVQEPVCRYRMSRDSSSHTSAIAVHEEALRLMEMWQGEVDPPVLAKCRRHHSTQMALAEMREGATFADGVRRLRRDGSIWSQVRRPFWYVFHLVRRNVAKPQWKTA